MRRVFLQSTETETTRFIRVQSLIKKIVTRKSCDTFGISDSITQCLQKSQKTLKSMSVDGPRENVGDSRSTGLCTSPHSRRIRSGTIAPVD